VPEQEGNGAEEALPTDPTAFQPMRKSAHRDTPVGFELEPITKTFTLDKSRIYQGWPSARNRHTDFTAAQATGARVPIMNGSQSAEYLGELFIKFFGAGYLGGRLVINFIAPIVLDDVVTARGVVKERIVEGPRVKLVLDVWLENQDGRKVLVGTAAGFAP
jgi:acyl dehydratase